MTAQTPEAQLYDELGLVCHLLGNLLGSDVGDFARERLDARARVLVDEVGDDSAAAADLLTLLGDRPREWWSTPLGLVIAGGMVEDETPVTHAEAAGILGVSRGTVAQLASRGTLPRCPGGGVPRGAVLARLRRLRGGSS